MPHRVWMNGTTLQIVLDGVVTHADLAGVAEQVRPLEAARGHAPDRIVDLTHATNFDVGYPTVSSLARQRTDEGTANRYRIVFVASTAVGFGIARMYQSVARHAEVEVHEVHTLEEALALVGAHGGGARG